MCACQATSNRGVVVPMSSDNWGGPWEASHGVVSLFLIIVWCHWVIAVIPVEHNAILVLPVWQGRFYQRGPIFCRAVRALDTTWSCFVVETIWVQRSRLKIFKNRWFGSKDCSVLSASSSSFSMKVLTKRSFGRRVLSTLSWLFSGQRSSHHESASDWIIFVPGMCMSFGSYLVSNRFYLACCWFSHCGFLKYARFWWSESRVTVCGEWSVVSRCQRHPVILVSSQTSYLSLLDHLEVR